MIQLIFTKNNIFTIIQKICVKWFFLFKCSFWFGFWFDSDCFFIVLVGEMIDWWCLVVTVVVVVVLCFSMFFLFFFMFGCVFFLKCLILSIYLVKFLDLRYLF